MCSHPELRQGDVSVVTLVLGGLWIVTWGREVGAAPRRKEMWGCPGSQELGGLVRDEQSSPSEHSDLVLDAALLPLESLLRDALDGEHAASQPLLGQDDLRKGSPVGKEEIRHSPAGRESVK